MWQSADLPMNPKTLTPCACSALCSAALLACSGASPSSADGSAEPTDATRAEGSADDGPAHDGPIDAGPTDAARDSSVVDGAAAAPDASATCPIAENDAGTCNVVDPVGPFVQATCSTAEPPQVQGGVVEDGTYVLQTFTYYGTCPPQAQVASTTWAICQDHWDVAQSVLLNPSNPEAGVTPVLRLNYTTSIQGSTVTFTSACVSNNVSSSGLSPRGYTATPGHLTFVYPDTSNPSTVFVSTYTRQ